MQMHKRSYCFNIQRFLRMCIMIIFVASFAIVINTMYMFPNQVALWAKLMLSIKISKLFPAVHRRIFGISLVYLSFTVDKLNIASHFPRTKSVLNQNNTHTKKLSISYLTLFNHLWIQLKWYIYYLIHMVPFDFTKIMHWIWSVTQLW